VAAAARGDRLVRRQHPGPHRRRALIQAALQLYGFMGADYAWAVKLTKTTFELDPALLVQLKATAAHSGSRCVSC